MPLNADMPTFTALYQFIGGHYKHSRFEGRNCEWNPDHARHVVENYAEELKQHGKSLISCHESITGQIVTFDKDLNILNADAPPVERLIEKGHLSYLF